jgi:hypothetical protein
MEPGFAPGSFLLTVKRMRMKPMTAAIAYGFLPLTLAACSPVHRAQLEEGVDPGAPGATIAAETDGSQAMQTMLEQIRADGAQRAGVAPGDVKILAVESVTWSDGSLGCPEPGMMYTQALVRGYRIRVDAAGTVLQYHANARYAFLHCPPDRARDPSAIDPT